MRFIVFSVLKKIERDCKLFAGFIWMNQDNESLNVTPEIEWFVCERDKEKRKNSSLLN